MIAETSAAPRPNKILSAVSSRDEMNLAEFPLTVLSTRVNHNLKTLEFKDTQRSKNGELIERQWIITGADKFGLPTATDDDVVLGLICLSMDQGFRERKVYFSRYELLKILRWTTEGRSYSRLTKSLDRLSGVRIRSTNGFYDNSSKSYQTCNFGIIDAYEINDERASKRLSGLGSDREPKKSFFIWSEMMFDSFNAGFIKKIDLDLYFSLNSAVSRRLYRYLDKHFYYKPIIEKPLLTLAFEKLGLSRSYQYISSIKQQIEPAAEELIKLGFLSAYEFVGKGPQTSVRFTLGKGQIEEQSVRSANLPLRNAHSSRVTAAVELSDVGNKLKAGLVERGITEEQAARLLSKKSESEMQQIERIITYYDNLVRVGDHKVSRNKIGFLYRAVESPFKFKLPASYVSSASSAGENRSQNRPELKLFRAPSTKSQVKAGQTGGGESNIQADKQGERQRAYHLFVESEVRSIRSRLTADEIEQIHLTVSKRMGMLRSVLDAKRFEEAVEGCVRQELAKSFGVPDFENWQRNRRN